MRIFDFLLLGALWALLALVVVIVLTAIALRITELIEARRDARRAENFQKQQRIFRG